MRPPRLYEPDLIASAVQATALMSALILPLALSIELKRTIIPVSMSVPIITEAQPAALPAPTEDIFELREQVRQRQSQTEADLARRRQQEEQRQQQSRQLEEQRQREAEEERRAAEQQRAEAERAEQEAREKRKELEQRRQREAEEARRAAEAAAAASLTGEQRASLIGRYTNGIKERVHRYMSNPEGISATDEIAVEVRVRLNRQGMLATTPEIERSSGIAAYDNQAIRAVIRAAAGGFELPADPQLRAEFGDLLLTIKPKK